MSQFAQFSNAQGEFGIIKDFNNKHVYRDAIDWWRLHGRNALELQTFRIRLLLDLPSYLPYGGIKVLMFYSFHK
jgi:hypothetical protein